MIAGPTEVLIIADGTASPDRIAADADAIVALAEAEGLHGHAEAVRVRRG